MAPGPPFLGDNRFAPLAVSPQPKRKKPIKNQTNIFPDLPKIQKENPKYLVISSLEPNKPLTKFSCFAVQKSLHVICKDIVSISELRDGSLLLLVKNATIAKKFLDTKRLTGLCDVEVKYHINLNSTRGTIFAPCLNDIPEEEIIENLGDQGVIAVFKFTKLINNKPQPTGVCLLTFDRYHLPDSVQVSWHSARVRMYTPNPMRCKKCQKLGHTTKRCNNASICDTCGLPPHDPEVCSRKYCVNCANDHPSSSNSCPKYIQSKEIIRIKTQKKCTMRGAIKLYNENNTTPTSLISHKSFATVTKETNTQVNDKEMNVNQTLKTSNISSPKPNTQLQPSAHSTFSFTPNSIPAQTISENNSPRNYSKSSFNEYSTTNTNINLNSPTNHSQTFLSDFLNNSILQMNSSPAPDFDMSHSID